MNRFYCILLYLIFFSPSYSQISNSNVVRIDAIPAAGILLDTGWRFHTGDNPQWAKPEFDDKDWENLSPTVDVHDLLKRHRDAGIGWFRLKVKIDSLLQGSSVALVISQVTASEIYLNGKLLYRFGKVSSVYSNEQTSTLHDEPFNIQLGRENIQEFAIRYSFNPKRFFTLYYHPNACVQLILKQPNQATSDYVFMKKSSYAFLISIMAIYLLLGSFCLYFYLSFRTEKSYKFIALNSFVQPVALLLFIMAVESFNSLTTSTFVYILGEIVSCIGVFYFFNACYILFNIRKPRYYIFFVLYVILMVTVSLSTYNYGKFLYGGFGLIFCLEVLRIALGGVAKRRPGSWLFLLGATVELLATVDAIYLDAHGKFAEADNAASIVFLATPIYLSLFMAGEFARLARTLRNKVVEVKQLSDRTLAQEQEKQTILSTEKERLEIEVQNRTAALNKSLQDLKSTQAQLIQSEKMASLGELTTGIAHEIQNPLNFINNFSDVNKELLVELNEEIEKAHYSDVREIAKDLIDNEEKINHHGKRADAIVKSMLQHSRTSKGENEPTDISRLADEYLRLAYHGFREKNKSFEAKIETDFDHSIRSINVVPQDIGRVLLNLINNAFYAVNERRKQNLNGYEPTVSITTRKHNDKVEIIVKDNANGIPQKILEKIFQPFFTTKPTGQGTGLGLSLAYDIVKAHGGEIKVETEEGEGSEFIIHLPVN
jgi:signal transduction histidine kinase